MAERNGWKTTKDSSTGDWTLECKDTDSQGNDNFETQEKTITVDCANKNFTGDLIVDVKARDAEMSASAMQTLTNDLTIKRISTTNNNYLKVSGNTSVMISGKSGWYTGNSYGPYNETIGRFSTENIQCQAEIYPRTNTGGGGGRQTSGDYYREDLNPNYIWVVCSDSVNFWSSSSHNTSVWDNSTALEGGAIVFHDKVFNRWVGYEYNDDTQPSVTCLDSSSYVDADKRLTIWLHKEKHIRPIVLNVNFSDIWDSRYETLYTLSKHINIS